MPKGARVNGCDPRPPVAVHPSAARSVLLALLLAAVAAGALTAQDSPTGASISLTRGTLAQDIATAGFDELVIWTERLGLSSRGSRSELQQRLYAHYEVAPPEGRREGTREITIESALESDYFVIDEINQRYIRLRGGVLVRMEDPETGVTHRIRAEEIIYNQAENRLTARGGVEYTIVRPDRGDERFVGDSITVFLNTWEGVFLEGESTRPRNIEDEEIEFRYRGRFITRSADDIIVMEDGVITSSRADPPNYHIRARRIWVLGPGEWGLQNAVLYVGRVPVFYFPFFFRYGDRLFFNPVAGFRSRQGTFIQTTTYLMGQKAAEDSSVSFLQLADEGTAEGRRVRDGLFLRPATEDDPPSGVPDDWTLKLLADVYSKTGAFVGLEGDLPGLGPFRTFGGSLGLGVSRPVRNNPPGSLGFTNYFIDADGNAVRYWDRTQFGGASLPFRYKSDFDFTMGVNRLNLRGTFELYSDRYVDIDFGDRAESMDWLSLVGQGPDFTPETVSEKRSLLWRLSGTYNAPVSGLTPWVQSLSVQNFVTSLAWNSKATDPASLPVFAAEADRVPQDFFFFPARLTAPDMGVRVTGTLLDSRTVGRGAAVATQVPETDLRSPWAVQPDDRERVDNDADDDFDGTPGGSPLDDPRGFPSRERDLSGLRFEEPMTYRIGYTLTPRLTVINEYDQQAWQKPDDIDFALSYSSLTSNNNARVSYQMDLYNRLFVLSGALDATHRTRTIYNAERLEATQRRNLETQAFRFESTRLNNDLRLSTFPFVSSTYLNRTNLSYTLNTTIVDRRFVDRDPDSDDPIFETRGFRWDDEFVRAHQVNSDLLVNYWRATQSLRVRADLPPLDERYTGRLDLVTGPLTSTIEAEARVIDEEWRYSPVTVTETLRFAEELSLRQRMVYNVEEDRIDLLSTSLRVFPVTASLNARYTEGVRFVGPPIPWESDGNEALRATDADVRIDYRHESDPLWRNRIRWGVRTDALLRMNLLRYTESFLDFRLGFNLKIHEFLDLSFSSVSRNAVVYQYVGSLADRVNVPQRSAVEDIVQSFNFGNRAAREDSPFNIQSISVAAVHHLDDWDFTVRYTGSPELVQDGSGADRYRWVPLLELSLVWRPIPEIRTEVRFDDDDFFY